MELPFASAVLTLLAVWATYIVYTVYYRLYLHPLSKFPGQRLAAATQLYEIYFNVVKDGLFIWEIERMHEKYGPIVRINPHELHIKDPDYYSTIYAGSHVKRDKEESWAMMAGAPRSAFSTADHDLHRMRRSALNPFFAKRSVARYQDKMEEKIQKLCGRLKEYMIAGRIVPAQTAFSAFTMDVITGYSYGEKDGGTDHLSDDAFKPEWSDCLEAVFAGSALRRAVPWMLSLVELLPLEWALYMMPVMGVLLRWRAEQHHNVEKVVKAYYESDEPRNTNARDAKTIFHSLLENDDLSPDEKSVQRIADEAEIVVGAGSETTARAAAWTTFYVINTPGVSEKLREELDRVIPDRDDALPPLSDLEKLPYLTGIIQEGLRLTYGATTRSPRMAREPMQYQDWMIPPYTPMSSTTYFISTDPSIFPDPFSFKPERWLKAGENVRFDKYLTNFGKGTRACLGMNLAYAELYLVLAAIFRRFEFALYETTTEDVRFARDGFTARAPDGSKGVRILVVAERA